MAALRQNLARAEKEREKYITWGGKGRITEAEMDAHLDALDKEKAEWQADLDRREKAVEQMATIKEIEASAFAIAETVRSNAMAMTLDEQKQLTRALVEGVWVDADNALTIEAAVPGLLPDSAHGDNGRLYEVRWREA